MTDFETDVLEASRSTPVVVDFWAEWCGPCRQLGPTIEKLAGEAGNRWKLVKIDTDKNPDIAIQFGVRGIPSVKMVYQEEVIAEFTGAQPEPAIRSWLQENLPGDGDGGVDAGELLQQVKQSLGSGDRSGARTLLEDQVEESSDDRIKVRYAMLLLPDRYEEAKTWFGKIGDESPFMIEKEVLETVGHLSEIASGQAVPEGDEEYLAKYRRASGHLFEHQFEEALELFIECLQIDRSVDEDGARKACVACFTMLGEQHPVAQKYRRRFSMSLY